MTPPVIRQLFAYNRWANTRLLEAAAHVSQELIVKRLGSSYESVFATLRHICWGEWLWLDRWRGRSATEQSPLTCRDLASLRARWTEIDDQAMQFLSRISATDLERRISYENPIGTRWTYSLRDMVQHVVNHSTYHRGQVAGMLRQIGTVPPATDYLVYLDTLVG